MLFLASCTSGRWIVVDESAVDRDEYQVIDKSVFLNQPTSVTPQNPVLTYQLLSKDTRRYSEKALMKRAVQDYKLRPGYLALGITGAATAFYLANSTSITGAGSSTQQFTLNALGGLMGLSGFLNMKPVGEPRFTGEQRYLRNTGTFVETDTLQVTEDSTYQAEVTVVYGDSTLINEETRSFSSGLLEINLANILSPLNIEGSDPGNISVKVAFQDSVLATSWPVNQVLLPFAQISSPITLLRNEPTQDSENVLAELVRGSQLQIVEPQEEWYKVLYGISENYIARDDAQVVWRSSGFDIDNQVVAVPRAPFGNIDVENNIPILSNINQNAYALLASNENYRGGLSQRNYALRDAQLIDTYLSNALGFEPKNIFKSYNFTSAEQLKSQIQKLRTATNDSSSVFIYLSGYGTIEQGENGYQLGFLPSSESDSLAVDKQINLTTLFRQLATIAAKEMVVLADIDFEALNSDLEISEESFVLNDPLQQATKPLTDSLQNAAIIFGSNPAQNSELYTGRGQEDKKHHIATYFFAKALQERKTNMAEIFQYLERNITFTSRKLHDRAQDPRFYGNIQIDLVNNE
ncbi:MAG: caspase family protein [Balneolaceae bacterium]|nr:caspase family protein [Balneolaceae bacterium]